MTGWRTAGPLSPAAQLQMGLWGSDPDGWARFAEPHNQPLFAAVLDATGTGPGTRLLDLGCGTGLLLALAQARGATVTGLDVTPGLLKIARDRLPTAELWQADICSLPFGAAEFDVVTGVNAVQFAADPPAALAGAARVVRPGGLVAIGTFAAPERAESTAVHLAMAALSPPRRQADHAPYALTRDNLAAALAAAGLEQQAEGEVECVWRYASLADAVRGLIGSAGGTRAVQDAGRAPVRAAIEGALAPFTDPSTGEISMRNAMRWVTARRPRRGKRPAPTTWLNHQAVLSAWLKHPCGAGRGVRSRVRPGGTARRTDALGRLVDFNGVAEQRAAGEPVGDRPAHRRRQQGAAALARCWRSRERLPVVQATWLTAPGLAPSASRSAAGAASCSTFSSSSTGPQAVNAALWSSTAGSPRNRKSPRLTCSSTWNGPTPSTRRACAMAASRSSAQ